MSQQGCNPQSSVHQEPALPSTRVLFARSWRSLILPGSCYALPEAQLQRAYPQCRRTEWVGEVGELKGSPGTAGDFGRTPASVPTQGPRPAAHPRTGHCEGQRVSAARVCLECGSPTVTPQPRSKFLLPDLPLETPPPQDRQPVGRTPVRRKSGLCLVWMHFFHRHSGGSEMAAPILYLKASLPPGCSK